LQTNKLSDFGWLSLTFFLVSCSSPEKEFEVARGEDTEEAYARFIVEHPNSPLNQTARGRLETIRWREAGSLNTVEAYQRFASDFPESTLRFEALDRIESNHWESARKAGTLPAYQAFLTAHRSGRHAAEAIAGVEELEWRDAAGRRDLGEIELLAAKYPRSARLDEARELIASLRWEQASRTDTKEGYRQFLQSYSDGPHARKAWERLEELTWLEAGKADTPEGYQTFIREFPESSHLKNAETRVERIHLRRFEAEPSLDNYEKYIEPHLSAGRIGKRADFEERVWKEVSSGTDIARYTGFLQLFPDGAFTEQARKSRDGIEWAAAVSEGTDTAYLDYLAHYPAGLHASDAKGVIEKFRWDAARKLDTVAAYQFFIAENPDSTLVAEAEALIRKDKELWKARVVQQGVASATIIDYQGTDWNISPGSSVVAEYLAKGEKRQDIGLHVVTYVWTDVDREKKHLGEGGALPVLAVLEGKTIPQDLFGAVFEIERMEKGGEVDLGFSSAELKLADGKSVHPCGIFTSDVADQVSGRLGGILFKGDLKVGQAQFKAIQSGPPFSGDVKMSLINFRAPTSFKFPSGGKVVVGMIFPAKAAEVASLTFLGNLIQIKE
jgi:hypothetical protein